MKNDKEPTQRHQHDDAVQRQPPFRPVQQSAAWAGSTFLASLPLDLVCHFGWTGLFVGGLASYAAWRHGPEIADSVRGMLSPAHTLLAREMHQEEGTPKEEPHIPQGERPKRNWLDRALGFYPEQDQEATTPEQDELSSDDTTFSLDPMFPAYPERVTLHLGKAIDREALHTLTKIYQQDKDRYVETVVPGRRFDPHFNHVIGKGWVMAAVQGSGKSILNGLFIEQAGHAGLPVIVFDHKGEYDTVKALPFMNTLLVGGRGAVDFVLTPDLVDEFVALVFRERYQAIISLPSYGTGWLAKANVVATVGEALMRYAEKQVSLGKRVRPCLVILDEAQLYLPQDVSLLPPEAQFHKTTTLAALKNAYFALVTNGRSAGYTVGFATQSLTYLAKWAIKSVQVKIYGRHVEKNDLDECERTIDAGIATRAEIETFPPGVAVVFGLTTPAVVVQFDQKEAEDKAETPGIERLQESDEEQARVRGDDREVVTAETLLTLLRQAGIDVSALQQQSSRDQEIVLTEQRARLPWSQPVKTQQASEMEDLPRKAGQVQAGTPPYLHPVPSQGQEFPRPEQGTPSRPLRHQEKYEKAITVWHDLETKGCANMRDFAATMGMGEGKAYSLLVEMERLGLIQWERRKKRL
jgi:hypothetical protein